MELVSDKSSSYKEMDIEAWRSLIYDRTMVLETLKDYSLRDILKAVAHNDITFIKVPTDVKSDRNLLEVAIDMATDTTAKPLKVEKSVTINKSPEDLYSFWRNLENLPRFTKHLESIKVIDSIHSNWVAAAPLGMSVKWDAEIILDEANYLIGWASMPKADIDNAGFVRFRPSTGGRGTEVKVVMEYNIAGGVVTAAIAKLLGEEPENQLSEDLHRFKQFMETGEIATTEGQSSGRR
jgi:uncharacterized membrane protein